MVWIALGVGIVVVMELINLVSQFALHDKLDQILAQQEQLSKRER